MADRTANTGATGDAASENTTYGRYIGRVGTLAVALGIGFAGVTGFGMSQAQADDDTGVSSANDGPAEHPADQPDADTPASEPTHQETTAPDPPQDDADELGTQTSKAPELTGNDAPSADPVRTASPEVDDGDEVVVDSAPDPTAAEPTRRSPAPRLSQTRTPRSTPPTYTGTRQVGEPVTAPSDSIAVRPGSAGPRAELPTRPVEIARSESTVGNRLTPPDTVAADSEPTTADPASPDDFSTVISKAIRNALSPSSTSGPGAPADSALMLALLAWARRETNPKVAATAQIVATAQALNASDDDVTTDTVAAPEEGATSDTEGQTALLASPMALRSISVTADVTSNGAPTAVNDAKVLVEDTPRTFSPPELLNNDTDPENDTLSVHSVDNASGGTVALNADGTVTFSPAPDYNGPASFTYKVKDSNGAVSANSATVSITLLPTNDPPTAVNDTLAPIGVEPHTITAAELVGNDIDPDKINGDTLRVRSVGNAVGGTVVLNADGTVTFTRTSGSVGEASFTYKVKDSKSAESANSATVTIAPENRPPTAVDDSKTVAEDTPRTFAVSDLVGNDSDPDISYGDTLHPYAVDGYNGGYAVLNADGSITFTPDTDYNGPADFTYYVADSYGAISANTATVHITVTPVNDAPFAEDDAVTVTEDEPSTFTANDLVANDTDPDLPYGETLQVHSVGNAVGGDVLLNADGTITFTPDADYNGAASFTYVVRDAAGAVSPNAATVNVSISPVDDAPVATDDTASTDEDTPVVIDVLANDTDPDGDPANGAAAVTTPAHGTLTANGDGTFTYTPDENFNGTDTFTYIATNTATSNVATVTITVNPVNDAPTAVDDTATTDEDTPVVIDVLANDTDPDNDTVHVDSVDNSIGGAAVVNSDGTITFTPDAGYGGPASFTYTVVDTAGLLSTNTATVTVSITPVNDAPTAVDDSASLTEDQPYTFTAAQLLGNDTDPENDTLSVHSVGGAAGGTVALNADGTVTFTPDPNAWGEASFTYDVVDAEGAVSTNTAYVAINIAPVNDLPVAVDDTTTTIAEDDAYTFPNEELLGNDTDVDQDELHVHSVGDATGGTVVLNGDGTVTFTPTANYNGTASFAYDVEDATGAVSANHATVTFIVTPVDDAPVAADDAVSTNVNTAVVIDVLANDTDVDGDAFTAAVIDTPSHGSLVANSDGTLTYTPDQNFTGTDSFTYAATNDTVSNTATVTILVNAVDAPLAAADPAITITGVDTYTGVVTGILNTINPGQHTLSYVLHQAADPSLGQVTVSGAGGFTFTPTALARLAAYAGTGATTAGFSIDVSNGTNTINVPVTVTIDPAVAAVTAISTTAPGQTGIAVNPDGTRIFVGAGNATIAFVDASTLTIVDAIPALPGVNTVDVGPNPIPSAAAGQYLYTVNAGSFNGHGTVSVVDSTTGYEVSTLILGTGSPGPSALAGTRLYVGDADGKIWVIDTQSNVIVDADAVLTGVNPISTGYFPSALAATANRLYATNASTDTVTVFDTTTFAVVDDIPAGTDPHVLVVKDNLLYVDHSVSANGDKVVSVLDATTGARVAPDIPIGLGSLAMVRQGNYIFASNANNVVQVIDTLTNTVVETIQAGFVSAMAASPDGARVYAYVADTVTTPAYIKVITLATPTPPNPTPSAVDDTVSTAEDISVVISPLANDTAPSGSTVSVVNTAAHGALTANGDGTLTYIPSENFNGTDTFSYTVVSGPDTSNIATVTITVTPVNDAPVAVDDHFTIPAGQGITFHPGDNDTDADGDTLHLNSVGNAVGGTVVRNADDTASFTPTPGFVGNASYTYTMLDTAGAVSNIATVTITYTPVNQAPTAVNDTKTIVEDTPRIFTAVELVNNDTDPEHNPLSVHSVGNAVGGTVALNGDGTVTFTPATDFNGAASFTYKVKDALGAVSTNSATVTVNVLGVNDAPIAVNDAKTVSTNTSYTFTAAQLLGNDTDPDTPYGDTISLRTVGNAANGTVALNGDGTVTFTPTTGTTGPGSFTYTIKDAKGAVSAAATVTITAVAEPVAVDTITNAAGVRTTWITFSTDGAYAYTANRGNNTVSVYNTTTLAKITDIQLPAGSEPLNINTGPDGKIYVVNRAAGNVKIIDPATNTIVNTITTGGRPLGINFDGNIAYVALGDGNAVKAYDVSNPTVVVQTYTQGTNGRPARTAVTPEGHLYITNQTTSTVAVVDKTTGALITTITGVGFASVVEVDEADHFAYVSDQSTNNVAVIDTRTDTLLRYIPTGVRPIGLQVDDATDRGYVVNFNGQAEGVTNPGSVWVLDLPTGETIKQIPVGTGAVSATLTPDHKQLWVANEGTGITIIDLGGTTNQRPTAVNDTKTIAEDTTRVFTAAELVGNDTDPEHNTPLSVHSVGNAVGGGVVLNTDGTVTFTPATDFNGAASFTYRAKDALGAVSANVATVTVNVLGVNDAPTAVNDTKTPNAATSYTFTAAQLLGNDTDPDTPYGDTLSLRGVGGASGGTVALNGDGTVTFTPTVAYTGGSFTYTVKDAKGAVSNPATVTVTPVNAAPTAVNDTKTIVEDTTRIFTAVELVNNDTDPEHNPLSVHSVGNAVGGTVALNGDGTVTFTPATDFNGAASFTYRVKDSLGAVSTNSATVTVNVLGVNDAPVAVNDTRTVSTNTSYTFTAAELLGNDTDPDTPYGDTISLRTVGNAANGTVALNGDGTVTFTPTTGTTGPGSFTYTIKDAKGAVSNSATVTIAPHTPVIDSVVSTAGVGNAWTVTVNAHDATSGTLTATDPAHVAVAANPNGTWSVRVTDSSWALAHPGTQISVIATASDGTHTATSAVTPIGTVNNAIALGVHIVTGAVLVPALPPGVTYTQVATSWNHTVLLRSDGTAVAVGSDAAGQLDIPNPPAGLTYVQIAASNHDSVLLRSDGTVVVIGANEFGQANVPVLAPGVTYTAVAAGFHHVVLLRSDGTVVALGDDTFGQTEVPELTGGKTYTAVYAGDYQTLLLVSDGTAVAFGDNSHGQLDIPDLPDGLTYTAAALGYWHTALLRSDGSAVAFGWNNTGQTDIPTLPTGLTYTKITAGDSHTVLTVSDGSVIALGWDGWGQTDIPDLPAGAVYTDAAARYYHTVLLTTASTAPHTAPDSVTTAQGTPATILPSQLLSNDTDPDNQPLTLIGISQGTHGTTTLAANGTITYTPNPDYTGADSFYYTASDGALNRLGIVTVTITPVVNQAPTAVNDTKTIVEDTPRIFTAVELVNNDTDPEHNTPLSVHSVGNAVGGAVVLNGDGTVTFTPATNFNGAASFTYKVKDSLGAVSANSATVTVNVLGVNDAPIAVNDSKTPNAATSYTFTAAQLLGNDTDPDTPYGDSVSLRGVGGASGGTVALNTDGTITFTPTVAYTGTGSFTYTIKDTKGAISAAATVTITPVNQAPTAVADTKTIVEDTPRTFTASELTTNDTDPEHGALAVHSVSNPVGGEVILNGDGTVTFTPATDFNGTASFSYRVKDALGAVSTNSATVTVNVLGVNDPPTAVNDTKVMYEDTPRTFVSGELTYNDTDPEHNALSVHSVDNAIGGTVALNGDGTITFTPATDFNGQASFTYKVKDFLGAVSTNSATVALTVIAVNDAPTAADLVATTAEDTPVTIDARGALADVDHDALTVQLAGNAGHGNVTLSGGGTFTYTPEPDFNGIDSFTYTVSDGHSVSNTATVSVTVHPVNDAPTAINLTASTDEDTPLVIDALAHAADADNDGMAALLADNASHGNVIVNADGTFTYTPDLDFNGIDSFTYTVTDGLDTSDIATVTVTVNPVNDAPVASDVAITTDEDTPVTIDVLAHGTDADHDALTAQVATDPSNGNVIVNADGTLTYTPDLDFNGTDSFTYTVTDGLDTSDIATITITVNPVNDAPFTGPVTASTDEDTPVTIDVVDHSSDPDSDPLTAQLVANASHGNVIVNADGTFTYTPDLDFNGTDSFTFDVTDGVAVSGAETVTVTVAAVNDPPIAADLSVTIDEDTWASIDLLTNAFDGDNDALVVDYTGEPLHGRFMVDHDGIYTYVPDPDFNGVDTVTYTVSDGRSSSNTATVTIIVNPINDAPTAADVIATTDEDTPATIALNAGDAENDTLTVAELTQGAHGTVIDNGDGTITYTPEFDFNGEDSFTYTVTDGAETSNVATVTIIVNPINDAPTAANLAYPTDEDTPVTIDVRASDADGDALTVAAVTQGAHGTVIDNGDGTITYTPESDFNGEDSFTYTLTDGQLTSNVATITVTVYPVNDPPAVADDTATTDEDTAAVIDVLANDTDVDNSGLWIASFGDGAHGHVELNADGTLTYTPEPGFSGGDTFTYTATDGEAVSATATVTVTVNYVDHTPPVVATPGTDNTWILTTNPNAAVTLSADDPVHVTVTPSGDNQYTVAVDPTWAVSNPGAQIYVTTTTTDAHGTSTTTTTAVGTVTNALSLGLDNAGQTDIPALPAGVTYTDVATGYLHTVLLRSDGTVIGIGDNSYGQINIPGLPAGDTYTAIAAGGGNTLLLRSDGTVIALGDNFYGQTDVPALPTNVTYTAIASGGGGGSSVLLRSDGQVVAVGDNTYGQLDIPALPAGVTYTGIDAGTTTTVLLRSDGTAVAIGDNRYGQTDIPEPPPGTHYTEVSAGGYHTVLLRSDGQVIAVGDDTYGQIDIPALPPGLRYTDISAGENHTVLLRSDGQLIAIGNDDAGQTDIPALPAGVVYTGASAGYLDTVLLTTVSSGPRAGADTVTTTEDTVLTIDPLSLQDNDTDPDGDTLTITGVSQGAHGATTVAANGTITYTPAADFNGTDTFTYTITDGTLDALGTVTVTITPVNDAPVATDDTATTDEDTPVIIDVLANDTDVEHAALSVEVITDGTHGSVTVNTDGTLTYTPESDFNGEDTFTYTVSDGQDSGNTATVTVTISAVNDAPTATDDSTTTPEDTPVIIDVLANDTDAENDSLSIASVTSGTGGTVTQNPDGTLTFTPNHDFNGEYSFSYTITDGHLVSNTATGYIAVTPVNDPPMAANDAVTTDEDTPVIIEVLANDTDVDNPASALSIVTYTQGAHGSVAANSDGTLTYAPDLNYNGEDAFTYTIGDGQATSNTATVTITVNPVDDPPVATGDTAATAEDTPLTIAASTLLNNDTDPQGYPLSITGVSQGGHGTTSLTGGTITYTPSANFNGTDTFTYTVSDGSLNNLGTVTVTVTPVNDAPVIDALNSTPGVGNTWVITVTAHDVDGDTVAVALTAADPAHVIVTPGAAGQFTVTADATWSSANPGTQIGVTATAADPAGLTATRSAAIGTVNNAIAIGSATSGKTAIPALPAGVTYKDASTSYNATVLLRSDGQVVAIGANTYGQLNIPTLTGGLTYTAIAAGERHTVLLRSDGQVITVGDNAYGQSSVPTLAGGLTYTAVAAGNYYTVLLRSDGQVVAFGDNSYGGTNVPTPPAGVTYTAVAAAGFHTVLLRSDGQAVAFGENSYAQNTISALPAGTRYIAVAAGYQTTVLLTSDGYVTVRGNNSSGQRTVPALPDGMRYIGISAAGNDTVLLRSDKTVVAFGENYSGQITIPTLPAGVVYTKAVAGWVHTVLLTATNSAPIAGTDSVTLTEDIEKDINPNTLLANDTDAENDALSITAVGQGAHGTTRVAYNGIITYQPAANFSGTDSFTYTVSDGVVSSTGTVNVTVTPVNDFPTLTLAAVNPGPYTGPATYHATAADVDGDTLTFTVTGATKGTVTRVANTTDFVYQPSATAYNNQAGTDTFTITVSDGHGGAASASASYSYAPSYSVSGSASLSISYPGDMTVSGDGRYAYVIKSNNGTVAIIDSSTATPTVRTVPVGSSPKAIAVSADGKTAYVTNYGSGTVSIINNSGAAPTVQDVPVGANPSGVSVSADGKIAYVANSGTNTVSIINNSGATPTVRDVVVGSGPYGIAASADGKTAYVTVPYSNAVAIIDNSGANPSVTSVTVASAPYSIRVSDDGNTAFVYSSSGTVSFISKVGSSATVIPVPGNYYSYNSYGFIALSADGKRAYVTDHNYGTVTFIDFSSGTPVPVTVSIRDAPHSVATNDSGSRAYVVAHSGLYVIDVSSGTPSISVVNVPANNSSSDAQQIVVNPSGTRVLVTDTSGNLTVLSAV